ncbi:MAG: phosphoglucosamine mutase [Acidobacteriota bacterium]
MRELKIGTSSVRGVVGQALHPRLIVDFACAFGTWVDGRPVVVGRDTRRSSPMVRSALLSGLMATGCRILDLGVASTPLVSYAVRELGAAGGVSVTGSHNDAEWNALKFIGPDGCLLNAARSEELFDIYHAGGFRLDGQVGRLVDLTCAPVLEGYLETLLSVVDVAAVRGAGLRVAVDFCGGSLGRATRTLFDRLGCELVAVHPEPGEIFPHPPEPKPEHLLELGRVVKEAGCHLGAALNIDGDRLALAESSGRVLSEELTLPLAVLARFQHRPGPVVINCSTAGSVEALASTWGQPVFRAPVGESFVMDKAMEEGAVVAGEGSGGVAPLPWTATFDALLTLGLVLDLLAATRAPLAEVVRDIPLRPMRKAAWRCPPSLAYRVVEQFPAAFPGARVEELDGVRLLLDSGWIHARVSRTEPVVRVILEADSEEKAELLLARAVAAVNALLDDAGPSTEVVS